MSDNASLIKQIRKLIEAYARIAPESGITIPDFQSIRAMNTNQLIGLRVALVSAIQAKAPNYSVGALGIGHLSSMRGLYTPIKTIASAGLRYPELAEKKKAEKEEEAEE